MRPSEVGRCYATRAHALGTLSPLHVCTLLPDLCQVVAFLGNYVKKREKWGVLIQPSLLWVFEHDYITEVYPSTVAFWRTKCYKSNCHAPGASVT